MVKLDVTIKRTIDKLLKSVYFLYILVAVAFLNIVGYLSLGDINSVIIFSLLGMITYVYSKNMIIVLGVPVLLTAFVSTLTTNNSMTRIEQFNNQEDEAEHEDDVEDDYEQHSNEHK